MPNTFELIASSTVGAGGAANITFSTIPATFTDLVVKWSLRSTSTSGNLEYVQLRFNGSSAANYTSRSVYGAGSTVASGTRSAQTELWTGVNSFTANNANDTASTFSNAEIVIPNYAGSTQKSVSVDAVAENNSATTNQLGLTAGIWTLTSAITSIALFPLSGNWVQHSTAYLYGVKNA
jgi:hypothetical protein